jgi:hypothetical protein
MAVRRGRFMVRASAHDQRFGPRNHAGPGRRSRTDDHRAEAPRSGRCGTAPYPSHRNDWWLGPRDRTGAYPPPPLLMISVLGPVTALDPGGRPEMTITEPEAAARTEPAITAREAGGPDGRASMMASTAHDQPSGPRNCAEHGCAYPSTDHRCGGTRPRRLRLIGARDQRPGSGNEAGRRRAHRTADQGQAWCVRRLARRCHDLPSRPGDLRRVGPCHPGPRESPARTS